MNYELWIPTMCVCSSFPISSFPRSQSPDWERHCVETLFRHESSTRNAKASCFCGITNATLAKAGCFPHSQSPRSQSPRSQSPDWERHWEETPFLFRVGGNRVWVRVECLGTSRVVSLGTREPLWSVQPCQFFKFFHPKDNFPCLNLINNEPHLL